MTNGASSSAGQFEVEVTFTVEGLDELELHVLEFHGGEGLSSLFSYSVDLACREADLDFSSIVGQPALITLTRQGQARHVHGVVSQFQQQRRGRTFTLYDATLEPRAFRLNNRVDCRIFQQLTMKEVVSRVLNQHQIPHRFRCKGNQDPPEREYCVQYRETDWNFVSRLLEEEGFFFFFQHTASSHELVISNDPLVHEEIPGEATLHMGAPPEDSESRERIFKMSYAEQVVPGKVALRDYNFQMPQVDFSTEAEGDSEQAEAELEVYDYPGIYDAPEAGRGLSQVRQQEHEVKRRGGNGSSDCARFIPGYTFTLSGHHQSSLNGQQYLLTSVMNEGATLTDLDEGRVSAVCNYANTFSYIPAEVPYRPHRAAPRPRVLGSQTAVVVGPDGQEIYTNEQGQVKVQFHWDRLGHQDDQSSCWVRVSQPWAGEGYGFMFIPRVGNEVVVDFLEGDPDRPLITGSVYHAQNVTPLVLPGDKTKSIIRSSSSPGGKGFNEICLEDRAGAELFYVHAQQDLQEKIRRHMSTSVGGSQSLSVGYNREKTVGHDEKVTIKGDETVKIKGDETVKIKGDVELTIDGKKQVTIEKDLMVTIKGQHSEAVTKAYKLTAKAVTLEAADSIEFKCGGAKIKLVKSGDIDISGSGNVKIKGRFIKLN